MKLLKSLTKNVSKLLKNKTFLFLVFGSLIAFGISRSIERFETDSEETTEATEVATEVATEEATEEATNVEEEIDTNDIINILTFKSEWKSYVLYGAFVFAFFGLFKMTRMF